MKREFQILTFLFLLLFPLLSFSLELPPVTNFTLQSAASSGNGTDAQISGYSAIGVSIIGTAGSDRVVTFSVSGDGTNFSTVTCRNLSSLALSTTLTTSGTTVYNLTCPIAGMNKFRAALSGGATGTITVKGIAIAGASVSAVPSMFPPFVIGDIFYADSTNSIAKLPDVASGSYLRSGGVGVAPLWSTPTLPNSAVVGDIPYASATNVYGNLADVAAGSYLRSGGVTTAPLWSTVTLPNSATTGDLLYSSASNVYGNLNDVATGSVLVSGGTSTAPAWSSTPTVNGATILASTAGGLNIGAIDNTAGQAHITAPLGNLVMASNTTGRFRMVAAPSSSNNIQSYLARGTLAVPTVSSTGDGLAFTSNSFDGSVYTPHAAMSMAASGTQSAGSTPGAITLSTTLSGAAAVTARVGIPATGGFYIGATAPTLTAGALGMNKITASASAPGAASCKMEVVCGTNAGTAKLIMACGTSATALTILDNVGAGVSGC